MDTQKHEQPVELTIEDLDVVVGGSATDRMLTLLTQLLQMKHEGLKSIAQNMRG